MVSAINAMQRKFVCFTDELRGKVIERLGATSDGTATTQSRLSVALEVKCTGFFLVMYPADLHIH